jgi:nucleotide-binding universal stress UspA family protein
MYSILVPTDFSYTALKAAMYAAEIARKSDVVICLLHATELGHEYIHQPFPLHEKYNELVKEERLGELMAFAKAVTGVYTDINVEIALINANVVDGVIEFCNRHAFDLIVMGTKGSRGIKEVAIGSVTANVIAKTRTAVLAVPYEYVMEEPDAMLFATSHYEREITLLEKMIALPMLFSATVHVVVFEEIETVQANIHAYNTQQIQQYVEFLKNTFPGISFKGELVQGTSFEGAIERYCIGNDIDIIGMITYPKNIWARMLHKSTTQKMTFHSRIPILAIPAGNMYKGCLPLNI